MNMSMNRTKSGLRNSIKKILCTLIAVTLIVSAATGCSKEQSAAVLSPEITPSPTPAASQPQSPTPSPPAPPSLREPLTQEERNIEAVLRQYIYYELDFPADLPIFMSYFVGAYTLVQYANEDFGIYADMFNGVYHENAVSCIVSIPVAQEEVPGHTLPNSWVVVLAELPDGTFDNEVLSVYESSLTTFENSYGWDSRERDTPGEFMMYVPWRPANAPSSTPREPTAVAAYVPNEIFGEWVITSRYVTCRIYAMEPDAIESYQGLLIEFGEDFVVFGETRLDDIAYETVLINEDDFYWRYGYTSVKQLGFFDGYARIVRFLEPNTQRISDGKFTLGTEIFVVTDNKIYMEWEGVYFELERSEPQREPLTEEYTAVYDGFETGVTGDRDNPAGYSYLVRNRHGEVAFSGSDFIQLPEISVLENRYIEVKIGAGTGVIITRYYDWDGDRISAWIESPSAFRRGRVAYMSYDADYFFEICDAFSGETILRLDADDFDPPLAKFANPSDVVISAAFTDDCSLLLEYFTDGGTAVAELFVEGELK